MEKEKQKSENKYISGIVSGLVALLESDWPEIQQAMVMAAEESDPLKEFSFPVAVAVKIIPGTPGKVRVGINYSVKYKNEVEETLEEPRQINLFNQRGEEVPGEKEVPAEKKIVGSDVKTGKQPLPKIARENEEDEEVRPLIPPEEDLNGKYASKSDEFESEECRDRFLEFLGKK